MSADCAILNSREKIMLFEIKGGNMAIKYIFFIIILYLKSKIKYEYKIPV